MTNVQCIIIGAGPIGLAAGIELKRRGISYTIIEKGCLVNSIYKYPVNMTFFSTSERLELGGVPFISHGPKPTRREALEYYRRVADAFELPVRLYEGVESVSKLVDGGFEAVTQKGIYRCPYLIVSTGFYSQPNLMGIPGEDLPKVRHYFDEPHPYARQKVLVVGGGNSAVDVALETWRCGSEVSMVVRESALKEGVKYWVRPDIENRIKEGAIACWFNAELIRIDEKSVTISSPLGEFIIENDYVLAMTGYKPDFKLFQGLGLAFQDDEWKTPVFDELTHQSNVDGLYLAGVICGGLNTSRWFIENARVHAERAVADIARRLVKKKG